MNKTEPTLDLFLTLRTALVDYAASILGCRAHAEDVVQDAYVRVSAVSRQRPQPLSVDAGHVALSLESAQAQAPTPTPTPTPTIDHPSAYMYRTVRNLSLNWMRQQRHQGGDDDGTDWETVASSRPTPEHEALYRDELRVMMQALDDLPERTRTAFELHRLRGCTFPQVADRMGISVGLAHQLVRDALTYCADCLGDND